MSDLIERAAKAIAQEAGAEWPQDAARYRKYAATALATAQTEAAELRAEVERLRGALEATRDHCPQCDGDGQYQYGPPRNPVVVPCEFCEIARATLAQGTQPHE